MKASWPWGVVLSLALAGLAAWFAYSLLPDPTPPPPPSEIEMATVVVAAQDIPADTKVESTQVETIEIPAASKPDGVYSDAKEVIGEVAQQAFYAGERISRKRFTQPPGDNPISELITEGKRAILLTPSLASYIFPERRVDVITTERGGPQTILQNVRVLAVNHETNPEKVDPTDIETVMVEVDPEQAERVAGVRNVRLTLRKPGDEGVREPAEKGEDAPSPPWPFPPPKPPPGPKHEFQMVQSTKVWSVELGCKAGEDADCLYRIQSMKELP